MGEHQASNPESLWSVKETARYFRTTVHSIYKMVERKQIPHLRIGTRLRFHPETLRSWVASLEIPGMRTPSNESSTHDNR